MKNRISQRLINHLNELRKRAVKEKNEKLRGDYWWLYFNAKGIEPEIREMILKAENRTLIEMIDYYGLKDIIIGDQHANLPPPEDEDDEDEADESDKSADDEDDHEDDIPPRQLGLWD